jgi:hypothetical protein
MPPVGGMPLAVPKSSASTSLASGTGWNGAAAAVAAKE